MATLIISRPVKHFMAVPHSMSTSHNLACHATRLPKITAAPFQSHRATATCSCCIETTARPVSIQTKPLPFPAPPPGDCCGPICSALAEDNQSCILTYFLLFSYFLWYTRKESQSHPASPRIAAQSLRHCWQRSSCPTYQTLTHLLWYTRKASLALRPPRNAAVPSVRHRLAEVKLLSYILTYFDLFPHFFWCTREANLTLRPPGVAVPSFRRLLAEAGPAASSSNSSSEMSSSLACSLSMPILLLLVALLTAPASCGTSTQANTNELTAQAMHRNEVDAGGRGYIPAILVAYPTCFLSCPINACTLTCFA